MLLYHIYEINFVLGHATLYNQFIHLVTANANIGCKQDNRKKVSAEDVISAIGRIGLEDYVEPLTLYLNEYRGMKQNCGVMLAKGSIKKRHAVDVDESLENDDTRDSNANPRKDDDAPNQALFTTLD